MLLRLLLALCCAFATSSALAQETLAGFTYESRVLNTSDVHAQLPLVVGMHWSGSTPKEFGRYLSTIRRPVRLILLQGEYPRREGYSFFPVQPSFYEMPPERKREVVIAQAGALARFLQAVTERYRSPGKPVLIGASQGGDLSHAVAVRHPDSIRLAVPMLATLDLAIAPDRLPASPAIVVLHGSVDSIVPISDVRAGVAGLEQRGASVRLLEYPDVGHDITGDMQAALGREIDAAVSP